MGNGPLQRYDGAVPLGQKSRDKCLLVLLASVQDVRMNY